MLVKTPSMEHWVWLWVKIWRACRETIWLQAWLQAFWSCFFCGWTRRIPNLQRTHTHTLLVSLGIIQSCLSRDECGQFNDGGRCSHLGVHPFPFKNGSGNQASSLSTGSLFAFPCSDATRYPLNSGKLAKDSDANFLTGHNPGSKRIPL